MKKLSFNDVQQPLREKGPDACIDIREMIGSEGVGLMKLPIPFLLPVYYIVNPEDAHELMVKHGDEAGKVELVAKIARSTFGNGILFSNGALWKRQRKLMQPAFHHGHIRGYGERMMAIAEKHLAAWGAQGEVDLAQEMHRLTLKIVVDILFSGDATGTMDAIAEAIHDIGTGFSAQAESVFLALMPDWFPAPALRQKSRGAKNFNRLLRGIIEERRRLGEAKSPQDLLTVLMYTKDAETGETMDDEQLRGELLTLYIAGHETTAWLLSWALSFLLQNPESAGKFCEELAILEGKPPTVEDLLKLPYSKMVIQETLRLRPPVWFMQRQTKVEVTLNGRSYPPNSMFMVLSYANHHDPKIFPEPKAFKPERWANDTEKHLPKGAYLPFALGSRICIGNGFALMEAQLLLNYIMQTFEMRLLNHPQLPKGSPVILGFAEPVKMEVKAK
jgi:cytochrome P450